MQFLDFRHVLEKKICCFIELVQHRVGGHVPCMGIYLWNLNIYIYNYIYIYNLNMDGFIELENGNIMEYLR